MSPLGSSTYCDEGPGWESKAEMKPNASVQANGPFCALLSVFVKGSHPYWDGCEE